MKVEKGVKTALIVSMVGLGTVSQLPYTTLAAGTSGPSTAVQEDQSISSTAGQSGMAAIQTPQMGTSLTSQTSDSGTSPTNSTSQTGLPETEQAAKLSEMTINGATLSQKFSPDTTIYEATVANSVAKIGLILKSNVENAVIKVNGEKVSNGVETGLDLKTGKNTFTIEVSDSSGIATPTVYSLAITRE
ncbi:cadherin-like beta sandwich domain-containing protein [Heyndrickxia coagulans]|uniref:cadherin-like beta sandwich domain-containing protein n=1 Tax=Heyndrickxia coagulans TaxID=1398 RepID=UPI00216476BB|nr:cadherin-like beta sandwich domain-containing protein [Heyndrickxia coagulans]